MAAYIIVRMHITDMEQYKEYTKVAPGDQVDLTGGHAKSARQDPVALEPQPPGRQRLGAAAASTI